MENHLWPEIINFALSNGAVTKLDQRGLMPLEEARKILKNVSEFRRGTGQLINNQIYWESDIAWAAIMSLENTQEFLQEASRIQWYFHPRGGRDAALIIRYGEAILPWLETFLHPDGQFNNVPWCLKDCLMAINTPQVFDFLWKIHSISDGTEGFPGPFASDDPGDADLRINSRFNQKAPAEPDQDADQLILEYTNLHPEIGINCLNKLAEQKNSRAIKLLEQSQLS